MNPTPLRLLLIEDSEDDALLVLRELRRGGYDVSSTRVETLEALERALDAGPWDAIITDYSLPGFTGLDSFTRVRQRGLDVPFFIVSGAIGEDIAVAAMKAGVHDFLLKDRLARLAPAVARELREAAVRAERLKMQEQLLLSDRLASLGMLAASVAHEINNPLASLMMNLHFAQRAQPTEELDGTQALREALECAERIRDIIRDIKIFSRPDDRRAEPVELHRVLDSSLRMAWNHLFHRARVSKEYAEVPCVEGSEARLGQVFLNLLINAAQAIPEGQPDAHQVRVVTRREPDGTVRVEIHDTGAGIPTEMHERIFEPFFTTKPVGVGTGLGLPICRRLVSEMGGGMGVESAPGRGSIFWVRLRPAQDKVSSPKPRSAVAMRGGLRVLIIDDEVALTRSLKRLLGDKYDVTALSRAQEALALIASGRRFDAILCDLTMPEMSGAQFHESLSLLVPEQARAIIFMTGGAFSEETRAFLARLRPPCLEKPIDFERLHSLLGSMPKGGSEVRAPPAPGVEAKHRASA
ncbi:response regulator [Hyalangium rubrum]|uniref:histidine kinase n=1 Tax=Hyalangium rubrum TaxID=3103134 RepID=A0ABU5H1L2_9BACT|nr:response regulator [Hyalangium sp. s54d21]MDY7227019.1 response regulator [Hyalangium sp. s54d21]